jgi:predicted extracellular nuclease
MTDVTIAEAVETFKKKYNFSDISAVDVDAENETIHVHTHNAKIWVDLPEYHEGFYVKMNVHRRPRK